MVCGSTIGAYFTVLLNKYDIELLCILTIEKMK